MPKQQRLLTGRSARSKKPWTVKEVQEPILPTVAESPSMSSAGFGSPEDGEELRESLCCLICLDYLSLPMVTACGHAFCYFCLKQWLDQAHHCPTCREEIENDPHPCSLITNLVEAALARFPDTTCTERLASEKTRFKEIDEPWDLSGSSDSDSESADTWDAIQRGERIFRDVNLTSSIMSDESSHSSSSSSADEQDGDADMLAVHEYSPARSATRDSDDDASESGSSDSETSMATYPQGDAVINVTSDEDGSDDNEHWVSARSSLSPAGYLPQDDMATSSGEDDDSDAGPEEFPSRTSTSGDRDWSSHVIFVNPL